MSISDIKANYMETTQSLYGAPTEKPDYFKEPNLLDAILAAFFENGIDITDSDTVYAGWDSKPVYGNPGGYSQLRCSAVPRLQQNNQGDARRCAVQCV